MLNCPQNKFKKTVTQGECGNDCVTCHSTCCTCNDNTINGCLSCTGSLYLTNDKKCVENCPVGTF